jgi:hypothetical protein
MTIITFKKNVAVSKTKINFENFKIKQHGSFKNY